MPSAHPARGRTPPGLEGESLPQQGDDGLPENDSTQCVWAPWHSHGLTLNCSSAVSHWGTVGIECPVDWREESEESEESGEGGESGKSGRGR